MGVCTAGAVGAMLSAMSGKMITVGLKDKKTVATSDCEERSGEDADSTWKPKEPFRNHYSSSLKGKKRPGYEGNNINQTILDYAGIQPDGSVDASKKTIGGRHAVSTNGMGVSIVGQSRKHVETAASKLSKLEEWIDKPVSASLISLALVFGKTMPKHFFLNALQTIHIIKDEFGYSFDIFMGLRCLSLMADGKNKIGVVVQYERNMDCVELHLKRMNCDNFEYMCLSTLIDKLYSVITCPETSKLYSVLGDAWMVRYPRAQSFKNRVNKCTEYLHMAYIVVKYIFLHRFPNSDIAELVHNLFQSCKRKKSMAYGLFDMICIYPNKNAVHNDTELNRYHEDPRTCLDQLRIRNQRKVEEVLGQLTETLLEILNNSTTKRDQERTILYTKNGGLNEQGTYMVASYKIAMNWLSCRSKTINEIVHKLGEDVDSDDDRTESEESEIEGDISDMENVDVGIETSDREEGEEFEVRVRNVHDMLQNVGDDTTCINRDTIQDAEHEPVLMELDDSKNNELLLFDNNIENDDSDYEGTLLGEGMDCMTGTLLNLLTTLNNSYEVSVLLSILPKLLIK